MMDAPADLDERTPPAPAAEPLIPSMNGRMAVAGIGGALLGAAAVLWIARRMR